jgi:ABC-2 type transport system ATP-binding protein
MEVTISIKDLNKTFKNTQALKNVNLEISKGMYGLLGPNGAGKTTLMKILSTLLKKDSGEISVCGVAVERSSKIREMIGYLPQDFSMYGNMNAYEALDYLATLSGMNQRERKEKIPQILEKVNLLDQRKVKVKSMSGGMKRRLGIAQAIIHNPKVIIVDEPTAGLDPEERVRFRNLLCEVAKERIVLLSTHIVGDIEATCERIAILNKGEIIFCGSVRELLDRVEGKVYTSEISTEELEKVKTKYLVTGILTTGSLSKIKVIANEKPFENAEHCDPDLEDAYMHLMNKQEVQ